MTMLRGFALVEQAVPPVRATTHAACWDICACVQDGQKLQVYNSWNEFSYRAVQNNEITLFGGERALVPTGWIFEIPESYSMRIHPRSGLAWKQGIQLANCEGIVDADYVQETMVLLFNTTETSFVIRHGDRIAQLELVPVVEHVFEVTTQKPGPISNRQGGFGSTGVST